MSTMRLPFLTHWIFGPRRWRRRAALTPLKRWWFRRTHEHCCCFSRALYAFLAVRLQAYVDTGMPGAPFGYPVDYQAPGAPELPPVGQGDTDFDAWDRDVTKAARAFREAAEKFHDFDEDEDLRARLDWAMAWLARWREGVWV